MCNVSIVKTFGFQCIYRERQHSLPELVLIIFICKLISSWLWRTFTERKPVTLLYTLLLPLAFRENIQTVTNIVVWIKDKVISVALLLSYSSRLCVAWMVFMGCVHHHVCRRRAVTWSWQGRGSIWRRGMPRRCHWDPVLHHGTLSRWVTRNAFTAMSHGWHGFSNQWQFDCSTACLS